LASRSRCSGKVAPLARYWLTQLVRQSGDSRSSMPAEDGSHAFTSEEVAAIEAFRGAYFRSWPHIAAPGLALGVKGRSMRKSFGTLRRTVTLRHSLAGALLASILPHAYAQDFPTRPLHILVPYAAGGVIDLLARTVNEKLAADLGQPVIVEARPGANGSIATDAVAKSEPFV
jgi:hypothetical protein